jgi:hypothetical protein
MPNNMGSAIRNNIKTLVTILLLSLSSHAVAGLTLVANGQTSAHIIVSADVIPALSKANLDNPKTMSREQKIAWAAHDLQLYIEKMSGAKLPIIGDDQAIPDGVRILVGLSKHTKRYQRKIPAGLTNLREEEGYAILSRGNTLVLAGNEQAPYHGTEYAVYFFLHRLGVRWYMPTEFGEIVPQRKSIVIGDIDDISRPDFKIRNWWTHWMADDLRSVESRWKIRNGLNLNSMHKMPGDSSVRRLLPPIESKDKPEFADVFAKDYRGISYPYMPNLSSAESVQYAANQIKQWFREHPDENSFGIGADDGLPRDFSKGTLALHMNFPSMIGRFNDPLGSSSTEEWLHWVQRVAAEVRKEFPNKFLSTNGYANRNTPPIGIEPDPSIWIMFAAIFSDTYHALNHPNSWMTTRQYNMLKGWTSLYDNVYMYNYLYYNLVGAGAPPIPLARRHAQEIPLLKELGVVGFWDEGRTVRGESGIFPHYLRARMMWDSSLDADALGNEYFNDWYGPAGKPAFEFWDAMETAIENTIFGGNEDHMLSLVYTPELIRRLESHLVSAELLAKGDSWAEPRVAADRATFNYLLEYKAMERAEHDANWPVAARHARRMNEVLQPAMNISRFYWDIEAYDNKKKAVGQAHGYYFWGTQQRAEVYRELSSKINGEKGRRLATLYERAKFKIDPRDDGRFDGWYEPSHDDAEWDEILTTQPFYAQGNYIDEQGFPYQGAMWYRFNLDIPNLDRQRKTAVNTARLYALAAETEAWIWVNGKFIGHRPYQDAYYRPTPIDMDITSGIRKGANQITVRLHTHHRPAQMAGGLVSRLFIYSPNKKRLK